MRRLILIFGLLTVSFAPGGFGKAEDPTPSDKDHLADGDYESPLSKPPDSFSELMGEARFFPIYVKGRMFGIKLYKMPSGNDLADLGFKVGDVIYGVNRWRFADGNESFEKMAYSIKDDLFFVVELLRDGVEKEINITL